MNCPYIIGNILHKRPSAHEANLSRWSIEDAEVLPLIYLRCHIGKGFIDIPYHLRVNSNLNVEGNLFSNGKVVLLKEIKDFFKEAVADIVRQIVQVISMEESTIKIRGNGKYSLYIFRMKIGMAVFIIERLKEEYFEPIFVKGIFFDSVITLFLFISVPIPLNELGVIIKPSLFGDKIKEHEPIQKLLRKFMCIFD